MKINTGNQLFILKKIRLRVQMKIKVWRISYAKKNLAVIYTNVTIIYENWAKEQGRELEIFTVPVLLISWMSSFSAGF